jgi:hypothetical protein
MFLLLNGRVPYLHHAMLDSGDVADDREALHSPVVVLKLLVSRI